DQRRLMLAMDMMRMALVGSVPLAAAFGHLTYPHLLAVAVIEGAASTVFTSTAMVFLRLLIPSGQFSRAMGQSQAMNATSSLAGPALGGALFAVDRVLPYLVDCASYLLSGAMLLAVSARAVRRAENRPKASEKPDRRVTAGLRWLWQQKGILRI